MCTFVVIVTYNGSTWIRMALESLRGSQAACTPIVVDNASTDDTVDIIKSEFPEVRLLPQSQNTGFGTGNNIGISHAINAGAEFIFLLNQDAYVTPNAIGQLTSFLRDHPAYAVATPLHCSPDLTAVDPQTQSRYLQGYAPEYLSDACIGTIREHYDIHGINAAAWMVRTGAFKIVGGFDPLFFMYGEDDDLIARFSHLEHKFALLPGSKIVHLRAKSARPKKSLIGELWGLSERARSDLLTDTKLPVGTLPGKIVRLLVNGLGMPWLRTLVTHDLRDSIAYTIATIRILSQFIAVIRSARRCALPGPHYLDLQPHAFTASSGEERAQ
jgi:GT2 family glycosyltransferase